MVERRLRSFVKAISWRLSASTITFTLSYAFTSNVSVSGGITISEVVLKTIWYYIHERIWNHIKKGVL